MANIPFLNNTSFSAAVTVASSATAANFITTTDTGIDINGIALTRVAANSAIRVGDGLETLGLLRSYSNLIVATTGTFGGLVSGITPVDAANFVTKAYVDGSSGGTGPFLPLAGGTMTGNINFNDDVYARFGNGNDLDIGHDASNSRITHNGVGNLIIQNTEDNSDIIFQSDDGSGGVATYFKVDPASQATTFLKRIYLPDDVKAQFGNSSDLKIYHDGSNSYIEDTGSGDLILTSNASSVQINKSTGVNLAKFIVDGSVELYFNSSKKFETTSAGINITGGWVTNGVSVATANVEHTDNVKSLFGNGNDLQIYHDGSNSFIDNSTGNLTIDSGVHLLLKTATGESLANFFANGANELFYDNSKKLSTGSVSVGTATTAGGTLIDGWITTTQTNAVNNTTIATTAYVNNKIALIPAGLVFQGTWNAATNTPTLASGTGTTGHFYIVSVAGSTNLDGITDWKVGDWAVFIEQGASDQWEKIDNSSVLDGLGTGNRVAKWDGSGTSNTLTNSGISDASNALAITINGNEEVGIGGNPFHKLDVYGTARISGTATFGGDVSVEDNLYLTDSGTNRAKIQLNSSDRDDLDIIAVSLGSNMKFFTVDSERMRINSAGNVGIGTTSPADKLDLFDVNDNVGIYFHTTTSGTGGGDGLRVGQNNANAFVWNYEATPLAFATSGAARLTVAANGNIKFNTYGAGTLVTDASGNITVSSGGGAGGPFLPLTAGSTKPLTGDLYLKTTNDANIAREEIKWQTSQGTNRSFIRVGGSYADNALEFGTGNAILGMILHANGGLSIGTTVATTLPPASGLLVQGNVGIGTTSPDGSLTVDNTSSTVPNILLTNTAGNSSQILMYDNSGGTQNASITFDQTSQNTLTIATGYQSPTDLNRINIAPAGNVALTAISGSTGAAATRVGIGTTSPGNPLEIAGANSTSLAYQRTGVSAKKWGFHSDNDATYWQNITDGGLLFTLRNGGNVGIGTTTPAMKLQIKSPSGDDGIALIQSSSTAKIAQIIQTGSGDGALLLTNGSGAQTILIRGTGNSYLNAGRVGIGTTSPLTKLHVTDTNAVLTIEATTNGQNCSTWYKADGNNQWETGCNIGAGTDYNIFDRLNSASRMVVGHNGNVTIPGNVGIGTTSPSTKLDVAGLLRIAESGNTAFYSGDYVRLFGAQAFRFLNSSGSAIAQISLTGNSYFNGGNVGIGTTSPDGLLHIDGISDSKSGLVLEASNNGDNRSIDFQNTAGALRLGIEYDNVNINLNVVNRSRGKLLTVRESGNVGIGVTGPTEKLQVAGNVAVYGEIKGYVGSSSNQYLSILQGSSQTFISTGTTGETVYFGIGPVTNVTNISVAGTATATNFILSSDKTLKDKIKDIKTEHIDVNWKNFELISEPGVKRSGVIAQELEVKHPEFVRTDKDGLKSVAYIDLLITKIAELEARLEKAGL